MDQQKEKLNKNAASEVTEGFLYALFNFYVSGYYLDLKREKYYAIGQMSEYKERYGTEENWSRMDDYIRECVHEDDQALTTEVSRIPYIRERLKKEQSYSVEVRDHGTGKERWYRYTIMRGSDENHAAASFMDVTDLVHQREEMQRLTAELKEQKEALQEKLRINAALSQEYTGIFMINCDDGSLKVLKLDGNQNAAGMIHADISYDDFRKNYLFRFALPEYSADVIRLSELPELIRYFKDGNKDLRVRYRTKPNQAGQTNFELYVVPFLDGDSNQIIFGCRCIDATISKEAEYNQRLAEAKEAAEKQSKELQEALTLAQDADNAMANAGYGMWHIILKDGVEPRMQANDKMAELLGVAGKSLSEEEMYHAWYDRIVPDAIPSVQASVAEMMAGHFSENTYQWVHPIKSVIYVRCGGTAGKLEDGSDYISGYHADVTDIVKAEEQKKTELQSAYDQLEKSTSELKEQYQITASLASDYSNIFIVDTLEGTIRTISLRQDTRELLSIEKQVTYPYNLLLDRYISSSRIYPEDATAMIENMHLEHVREELKDKDEFGGNYRITEDGAVHYFKFTYRTVAGTKYVLLGFQNIDNLMADEIKRNKELEGAKKAAEAASAAKTSFLFNMSHDIRTPMNAIIGFTDLLQKHLDDRELAQQYIGKIRYSNDFLLSLINNVLEMARIESGKETLDETECNVQEFENLLVAVFASQMQEKGLEFRISNHVEHQNMMADITKSKEIFLNVLSNALKYTSSGSVTLETMELPSDMEGWALYRTVITDTGIGMSKEFLPHLYDDFSRERNSTDSKIMGTGLGMPIVKSLVDLMQGTIEVESEPGKGTTFTITIPHRVLQNSNTVKEEKDATEQSTDFEGKRILLAEDNDLNAEIAMEILGEAGFEVERAADGVICVDMLQKAACGYYDVILMDIQMPNMDGYKATQIIRSMNDPGRNQIPIISMTANAFDEDRKNALAAGMNGHLAKPIDIPKLMETLASILK